MSEKKTEYKNVFLRVEIWNKLDKLRSSEKGTVSIPQIIEFLADYYNKREKNG